MYRQSNFDEVVKKAFSDHGVSNPELEKALITILNQALDSRMLSKRIYRDIRDNIKRDEEIVKAFNK